MTTTQPDSMTKDEGLLSAAIEAVAQIEMDREGYPLSRTQEEIYEDAAETAQAVLALLPTPSSADNALREALERITAFLPHDHSLFAESVRHIANDALTSSPAAEVEPAAWMYESSGHIEIYREPNEYLKRMTLPCSVQRKWTETPLYAAPVTPAPASSPVGVDHPLFLRACEVVRHAPTCPGLGKWDDSCTCDAVAFLDCLKVALSSSSGEPASVAGEAAEDMLRTAKELRDNANGDLSAIQQAIMWEHKAAALSNPTPVEAGALRPDRDVIAYSIIEGSAGIRAAEHAKDFQTANWTDALRSADSVIAYLAALSQPGSSESGGEE